MVLIVQADTDDSSDIRNWWPDAHMVIYEGQLIDIDCRDLVEFWSESDSAVILARYSERSRNRSWASIRAGLLLHRVLAFGDVKLGPAINTKAKSWEMAAQGTERTIK
jgi:hypothetical protein